MSLALPGRTPGPAPATSAGRRGPLDRVATFAKRNWAVAGLFVLWQAYVSITDVNEIVMPPPLRVVGDIVTDLGAYAGDTAYTAAVAFGGLALGMLAGFLLALVVWSSSLLAGAVTPAALVLRSIPIVAVIPVLARLIGYDNRVVLAVTTLISFFPTFVLTGSGLRMVPAGSEDLFRLGGAGRAARLRHLLIPAAVPNLLVALRLSAATSVLAAMVAEFLIGTRGLGELFSQARIDMEMPRAWGAALIAAVLSVSAFLGAARLERWGAERFR